MTTFQNVLPSRLPKSPSISLESDESCGSKSVQSILSKSKSIKSKSSESLKVQKGILKTSTAEEEDSAAQVENDSFTMTCSMSEKSTKRRDRAKWNNTTESLAACIGCLLGLGNALRFPYQVYKYGGGSFMFAYFMIFVFVAFPTFFLELALGQFTSMGPVGLFKHMVPALEGLGICSIIVLVFTDFYYNGNFSILLFYTFASFGMEWKHCESPWNSKTCFSYKQYDECVKNAPMERWYLKGQCYHQNNFTDYYSILDACIENPELYKQKRQSIPNVCVIRFKMCFTGNYTPANLIGFTLKDEEHVFMERRCRKYWPSEAGSTYTPYDKPTRIMIDLKQGVQGQKTAQMLKNTNMSMESILDAYCRRWELGEAYGCDEEDHYKGLSGPIPCARAMMRPREEFSSEEFYKHHIQNPVATMGNLRGYHYGTPLCLGLSVVIVGLCVIGGPKWMGRVVVVSVIFPVIAILILTFYGLSLPGYQLGIYWYLRTDWCKLYDPSMWLAATSQIFFSMSVGVGLLIHLAAYNRFHQDVIRDAFIIAVFDAVFSFITGFAIFGAVGYMAEKVHGEIADILQDASSLELALVPLGQTIATLPGANAWGVLFYFTLSLLAVDNSFLMMETVLSFFNDTYPVLRMYRVETLAIACTILFTCCLPFVSKGGQLFVELIDSSLYNWVVPPIAAFELIGVVYIYGYQNILNDIDMIFDMSGFTGCFGSRIWKNKAFRYYMVWMWSGPAPLAIIMMMFSTIISQFISSSDHKTSASTITSTISVSGVIRTMFALSSPVFLACMVLYNFYQGKTWKELVEPNLEWGPALNEHRSLDSRYSMLETKKRHQEAVTAYRWLLVFISAIIVILMIITTLALLKEEPL